MCITIVDTETTGLSPATEKVCEYAQVQLLMESPYRIIRSYDSFVSPGKKIPPEVSAIHHITDDMVAESPSLEEVLSVAESSEYPTTIYCAHNAKFDRGFLPTLNSKPWICTYKLAAHFWPDAPSHSNQVLRYWLGLKPELHLAPGLAPHRALYDVLVTTEILREILAKEPNIDNLIAICSKPILLGKIRFGKHAGKAFKDLPYDYLRWLSGTEIDENTAHTVKYWMERRK